MRRSKIRKIVLSYQTILTTEGISPQRMDPKRKFSELSHKESLEHALFACGTVLTLSKTWCMFLWKYGRINRHLTVIQMCLSYGDWYTLEELMQHNRSG